MLCIPIHAQDRVSGVLYMESRFQSGRFTPDDQRLLMAFGDQVAIALTNAQLLADNVKKADELQRAYQEIEALAEERGQQLSQRTEQLREAQRDLAETRALLEAQTGKFGMIGASAALRKVFTLIERVSATDVPVLVEGESGTGKEMVARAIHNNSNRRKRRLVSVNCAAIPENLLESELFGHVRGAFTGADRERKGLFQAADGGTLFLDEISDMPARMQVDLLRALQEKMIRPVGGQRDIAVDVRVIAAANRPLADVVKAGTFREDLFYRLHVVRIVLPPLRQRVDDIPLLVEHFLQTIAARMKREPLRITKAALHRLMAYAWPGNVLAAGAHPDERGRVGRRRRARRRGLHSRGAGARGAAACDRHHHSRGRRGGSRVARAKPYYRDPRAVQLEQEPGGQAARHPPPNLLSPAARLRHPVGAIPDPS